MPSFSDDSMDDLIENGNFWVPSKSFPILFFFVAFITIKHTVLFTHFMCCLSIPLEGKLYGGRDLGLFCALLWLLNECLNSNTSSRRDGEKPGTVPMTLQKAQDLQSASLGWVQPQYVTHCVNVEKSPIACAPHFPHLSNGITINMSLIAKAN